MTSFTDKDIDAAISRLPKQSNGAVYNVLKNARQRGVVRLIEACEAELLARGPVALDADQAQMAASQMARAAGQPFDEVVEMAFTEVPATNDERRLLQVILDNPNVSLDDLEAAYGDGGINLTSGHLVYDRMAFFRHLLVGLPDQSSLLLLKTKRKGRIVWALRPEAEAVLRRLEIVS